MNKSINEMRIAKKAWADTLLGKPNVVSVGIGYKEMGGKRTDELCVVVGVSKKIPPQDLKPDEIVPKDLGDDIRTDVIETGVIKTIQANPKDRWRPAPGGVSIGHPAITAGTLGMWVMKDGKPMILSNNHILAAENNANIGDPILQPGIYDHGNSDDVIAHLHSFKEIYFDGGVNFVDAALAWATPEFVDDRVLEIGEVVNTRKAFLGMKVQKYGRTTGHTIDEIRQTDVTVKVDYGNGRNALFVNQLMAGAMCAGGDSGSLVTTYTEVAPPKECWLNNLFNRSADTLLSKSTLNVKMYHTPRTVNERAVGLLFAGSQDTTVINQIQDVIDTLGGFEV